MSEAGDQRPEVGELTSQRIRVAVLFERLGPYHHARLNAAGRLMQVVGMEACGMEGTYAWAKVEGAASFTRLTLTDRHLQKASWRKELHRQTWKALNETRPQAVAVPGWSSTEALSALAWCLQTRIPAVMMSESTEWDERREPWKEWTKRRLIQICSAALVGGTPHADYLKKLGTPAERIFPGYDAVDNDYFAKAVQEIRKQKAKEGLQDHETTRPQDGKAEVGGQGSEVRGPYGLPDRYFLASARFVEKKNLPGLLRAFARYRELADNGQQDNKTTGQSVAGSPVVSGRPSAPWSLVLLGDGPLRPDLCRLISDLRLDACVQLPGFKQYDELPVYYGLASAFVHASTTEQWGLVVNEAMAGGLPVLVSNRCGCAQDLVKDGVNGFAFDPYDVEQLASLMLKVWEMEDGRREFGAASREIISNWGPERFAAGLKQAVECALRVGPANPTFPQRMVLNAMLWR